VSRLNGDASLPNDGWQQDGQPRLWMSNLDLVWKTQYHINRFGTGAFLEAFKGVWSAVTDGKELSFEYMGKPSKLTYDYAHDRLLRDYGRVAGNENQQHPLKRVYMVGDNPESDIRGALEYNPDDGTEYVPILVRTGVWRQTEREREPKYQPAVIVDDVLDAVVWALRNEGVDADRKTLELEAPSSLQDMAKRAGISI
jgi:HAD superfamily hydrolase (TIGR01456 family)